MSFECLGEFSTEFSVISGALFIVQMIHWRFRLDLKIIFDCMWVGFLCCMLSTKYEHKDEGPLRVQFFGLAQISYTLLSMPSFSAQHHRNTNIHGFDRKERPLSMSSMDNHIHPSIYIVHIERYLYFYVQIQLCKFLKCNACACDTSFQTFYSNHFDTCFY